MKLWIFLFLTNFSNRFQCDVLKLFHEALSSSHEAAVQTVMEYMLFIGQYSSISLKKTNEDCKFTMI